MKKNWNYRNLQEAAAKNHWPPLLLLYGEDLYLIQQSLKLIKKSLAAPGTEDFNYNQFHADNNSVAVRDAVELLPMMNPLRLVVYHDVHKLKEKDWDVLQPILETPVETACFVLVARTIDQRKKIYKQIKKTGQLLELKRPYDDKIPKWINYIAQQRGLHLSPPAVEALHHLLGNNLSDIDGELEKLSQCHSNKKEITGKDVSQMVSRLRIDTVFDLAEAIGRKDQGGALVCLASLLEQGQSEVAIVGFILRHIRILAVIKDSKNLRGPALGQKVGVPHFFLSKYLRQSQAWEESQIRSAVEILSETDRAIKSSPLPKHLFLENFVIKACNPEC